jgi:hypothetical protein
MTCPKTFLWAKTPRNGPSDMSTAFGEIIRNTREAIADRKTSFLNSSKYSSPLSVLAIPMTPSTKKKYMTERRSEVCGSTDQKTDMKR